MGERNSNEAIESSEVCYDTLEQWARGKIQAQLQQLLEEEVTTFLGRARHERRGTVSSIDPPPGSRNGYGKPRAFSMMSGTVTVRRPSVRDLTERFESKVLPLFTRRTQEVGTVLPDLYVLGSKKWTPSTYDLRSGGVRWNEFHDSSTRRSSESKQYSLSWNSR